MGNGLGKVDSRHGLESMRQPSTIRGVTLTEALITIAVIGVLTAVAAPNVKSIGSKPLPDTANQVAGAFRQARARAIALTSPIKIKPVGRTVNPPPAVSTGGSNTRLEVWRATSTTTLCNSETGWVRDSSLSQKDLTYITGITQQVAQIDGTTISVPTAWEVCFNTRGMASISNLGTNNFVGNNVVLTFQEGTNTAKRRRIEIFPAGGIQVYDN